MADVSMADKGATGTSFHDLPVALQQALCVQGLVKPDVCRSTAEFFKDRRNSNDWLQYAKTQQRARRGNVRRSLLDTFHTAALEHALKTTTHEPSTASSSS